MKKDTEIYRLTEDFAGKKKGDNINIKLVGDKSYAEWKYKGCGIILTKDSQIIKKITNLFESIDNIDDVYKELGRNKPTLKDYSFLPKEKRERALNSQYIDDISELFNEGWIPNFDNRQQYKYYPYFIKESSGWRLDVVSFQSFSSFCGSGFYFKDRESATFCANKFLDIYKKVLD